MNPKGRIKEIRVEPLPGDHIDDVKKMVKQMSVLFDTKVYFNDNSNEFICDSEGNIAKLN